jgi:hypothetical protein
MSITHLFDYQQPTTAGATILGLSLILAASVGGYSAYKIKVADDMITVTGSAKRAVTADMGKWSIVLEARSGVGEQQAALDRLETGIGQISSYLEKQGISDMEAPVASVNPTFYYPQNSEPVMSGYTATREIVVRSADIDRLALLANNLTPLAGTGYTVSTRALELTYSKLSELRVELLSDAISDARARADAVAMETGRTVHVLRSASSGVVQVLPLGGVDVSDYGSYDTQSKEKEVMVTVRAEFSLE